MIYGQRRSRNRKKDMISAMPPQKKIFAAALFAGVLLAAFQMPIMKNGYDVSVGIFSGKLYIAFYVLCAVAVAVTCAASAIFGKDYHYSLSSGSFGVTFSASVCLTFLALFGIYTVFFGIKGSSFVDAASYILALLACPYFCIITMNLLEGYGKRRYLTVFCMVLVLHFIFRLLSMYFKVSGSYNDPVWNIHNFAQAALMLYFLQETRCWLKRAEPNLYHVSACAAVTLCLLSVSAEVASALLSGSVQIPQMLYAAFRLSCVIYISVRVLTR